MGNVIYFKDALSDRFCALNRGRWNVAGQQFIHEKNAELIDWNDWPSLALEWEKLSKCFQFVNLKGKDF